ncbi:MAG: hypothetical protein WCN98_07280 [Verrucomicrobiaceae bacterium]
MPTAPTVQIMEETIRVVPVVGGGGFVQQSPDGKVKIEGELTITPVTAAPAAVPQEKKTGTGAGSAESPPSSQPSPK